MPSDQVMRKFKRGELRSGSKRGPKVKSHRQAVAIMISERNKERKQGGRYHGKKRSSRR